jgi:hypothetical protein
MIAKRGLKASLVRNYTVRKSFGLIWCRIADVLQTANPSNIDNYKLKGLIQQFNLAGDLIQ